MKSHKTIKVLLVIAAICIMVGGIFIGAGFVQGGNLAYMNLEVGDFDAIPFINEQTSTIKNHWNRSLASVQEFDFDIDAGDVEIVVGDKNEIEFYNIDENKVEVKEDGRKQEVKIRHANKLSSLNDTRVIITLKDTVEKLEIDLNVGNLKMKDMSFTDLELSCNLGDMELQDIVTKRKLSLEADAGNIAVSGDFGKEISIENHLGNVDVRSTRPRQEYDVSISNDLGNTKVDGESYHGKAKIREGSSAKNTMSIDNNMGNITINFQ